MQKNSHVAADWFPKSTAECIGLLSNPKTNANLCPLLAWFPKNMMIRYAPLQTWKASQPPQVISLAIMKCIANEIEGYFFLTTLTLMKTDLRFTRHIQSVTSLALNNIFAYLSVSTEVLSLKNGLHSYST